MSLILIFIFIKMVGWSEHNNRLSKGQIYVEIYLFQVLLLQRCEDAVVIDLQLDMLLLHLFHVLETQTGHAVSVLLLEVVVCYLYYAHIT